MFRILGMWQYWPSSLTFLPHLISQCNFTPLVFHQYHQLHLLRIWSGCGRSLRWHLWQSVREGRSMDVSEPYPCAAFSSSLEGWWCWGIGGPGDNEEPWFFEYELSYPNTLEAELNTAIIYAGLHWSHLQLWSCWVRTHSWFSDILYPSEKMAHKTVCDS